MPLSLFSGNQKKFQIVYFGHFEKRSFGYSHDVYHQPEHPDLRHCYGYTDRRYHLLFRSRRLIHSFPKIMIQNTEMPRNKKQGLLFQHPINRRNIV